MDLDETKRMDVRRTSSLADEALVELATQSKSRENRQKRRTGVGRFGDFGILWGVVFPLNDLRSSVSVHLRNLNTHGKSIKVLD